MKDRMRRMRLLLLAVLPLCLAACAPPMKEGDFVGKWRSSRTTTPVYLDANGEWEIRTDAGTVLQYGIWRYSDHKIMWTYKMGSGYLHEANAILSFEPREFKLRETNGSETTFTRLD